jgi:hypothetical protein
LLNQANKYLARYGRGGADIGCRDESRKSFDQILCFVSDFPGLRHAHSPIKDFYQGGIA